MWESVTVGMMKQGEKEENESVDRKVYHLFWQEGSTQGVSEGER